MKGSDAFFSCELAPPFGFGRARGGEARSVQSELRCGRLGVGIANDKTNHGVVRFFSLLQSGEVFFQSFASSADSSNTVLLAAVCD